MVQIDAIKDGDGNIIIKEDSFEMLLACLDNQKFTNESPQNGDSLSVGKDSYLSIQREIQDTIDSYNRAARQILHQKYIFETSDDGFWLTKRYEHQKNLTPWSGKDIGVVYELFKDTKLKRNKTTVVESGDESSIWKAKEIANESEPWLIERAIRYGYEYLTISEDGSKNRPWKKEEIDMISKKINRE